MDEYMEMCYKAEKYLGDLRLSALGKMPYSQKNLQDICIKHIKNNYESQDWFRDYYSPEDYLRSYFSDEIDQYFRDLDFDHIWIKGTMKLIHDLYWDDEKKEWVME